MSKATEIIAKEAQAVNPYPEEELTKEYIPVDPAGGIKIYEDANGKIVNANKVSKELIDLNESDDSKHYPVADYNAVDNFKDGLNVNGNALFAEVDNPPTAGDIGLGNVQNPTINSVNMASLDDSSMYAIASINRFDSNAGSCKIHLYAEDTIDIKFTVNGVYSSGWDGSAVFESNVDKSNYFDSISLEYISATNRLYVMLNTNTTARAGTLYCSIYDNEYFDAIDFTKITSATDTKATYTIADRILPSSGEDLDDRLSITEKANLNDAKQPDGTTIRTAIELDHIKDVASNSDDSLGLGDYLNIHSLGFTLAPTYTTSSDYTGMIYKVSITGEGKRLSFFLTVGPTPEISIINYDSGVCDSIICTNNLDVMYCQIYKSGGFKDTWQRIAEQVTPDGELTDGMELWHAPLSVSASAQSGTATTFLLPGYQIMTATETDSKITDERSETATLTNKSIDCNPDATDPNIISNALINRSFEINYDDSSPVKIMDAQNILVKSVHFEVKTAWNGTQSNNSVKVGDEDDDDGFLTDLGGAGADVLGSTGFKTEELCARGGTYLYPASCGGLKVKHYGTTSKEIRVAVAKDASCTQGVAVVYIQYIKL